MGTKKKQGKERLDKYYHLAKSQGYRARSAFKLIQLNKKYNFLEKSRVLIDLCAAPGGWLQVAAKYMPISSLIVGVDLAPIKPIPRVITHMEDITTEKCRTTLKQDLKDWKADVVLHDGAPNVGAAWVHDAYSQSELTLSSLKLATEFLAKGGTFVTKVFRSKDYNNLMWVFQQLFARVEATKPPSSRNVSAEIFVVCQQFHAPKKIDPRFLDPRFVFRDLEDEAAAAGGMAAAGGGDGLDMAKQGTINDLLFPEKASAKRKRDGYQDGDYTLHHTHSVGAFLRATDAEAIGILAKCHTLTWDAEPAKDAVAQTEEADEADEETETSTPIDLDVVRAHSATDAELLECFRDLRVLGRKDFKAILRWRKLVRSHIGLDGKAKKTSDNDASYDPEETLDAAVPAEEDEEQVLATLESVTEALSKEERREEKRRRLKLAKERRRMQLNMITPADIGQEANEGDLVDDMDVEGGDVATRGDLFALRGIGKRAVAQLGDASLDQHDQLDGDDEEDHEEEEATDGSDGDDDHDDSDDERLSALAGAMDANYDEYLEQVINKDPKLKVKQMRAREKPFTGADEYMDKQNSSDEDEDEDQVDEEMEAATARNPFASSSSDDDDADDSMSDDFNSDNDDNDDGEETDFNCSQNEEATPAMTAAAKKASVWFSQSIFNDVDLAEPIAPKPKQNKLTKQEKIAAKLAAMDSDPEDNGDDDVENTAAALEADKLKEEQIRQVNETLSTAEAITLAMKMAQDGGREQRDVLDDYGYNRYAYNDDADALPKWFADDEARHNRPILPVTKEAVELMKKRQRELDARPIKKVMESKARKKHKMLKRLESMRKKTNSILDEGATEGGTTGDDPEFGAKLGQVSTMVKKAVSKAKAQMRKRAVVVVARGGNRANPGRPRGVKGRYKMVDSRMKKEVRADKRRAKAHNPGNRRKK